MKLGIYTRLSRKDNESNSIQNQLREGKEVQNKLQMSSSIYNEGEGVSGTSKIKDRPELSRLIDDINAGIITHVWMRDQDRLERSGSTFYEFSKAVVENNIIVQFGNDVVDFSDPDQFMLRQIISAVNSHKPSSQSKKTIKTLQDNARLGKQHGKRTYGYTSDEHGFIIIDKKEAKVVKKIFQLSNEGMGTKKIAEYLNRNNIPTLYNSLKGTLNTKNKYTKKEKVKNKSDIKWKDGTVYGILTSTWYKGIRKWKIKKNRHDKNPIIKEFKVPIIIEPHVWERTQDNLSKNANKRGYQQKYPYLLKGMIRCYKCGENFYGRTRKSKKDNYYMCSSHRTKHKCGTRSINIDFLDDLIWNKLFQSNFIKERIQDYLSNDDNKERIDQLKKETKTLSKKVEGLRRQKIDLAKMSALNGFTEDELTIAVNEINDEMYKAQNRVEDIKRELVNLQKLQDDEQDYLKDLDKLNKDLPFEHKQNIIKKYIGDITIESSHERRAHMVTVHFKLDAQLYQMFIIDFVFRWMIDVSHNKVDLLNGRYVRMSPEKQEEAKKEIYDKFLIQTNIPTDTIEDLEDLVLQYMD